MNQKHIFIALALLSTSLLSAAGIAVVSGNQGKCILRRANKSIKYTNGTILESNDVLETEKKSGLALKFVDNLTSMHLFSSTQISIDSKAIISGLSKQVELNKGSLYVKQLPGSGTLNVAFDQSKVSSDAASFLIRTEGGGKAWISVFSGTVTFTNKNGAITTLEAGRSAEMQPRGQVKANPAKDSELTAEELAVVKPTPEHDKRRITVPMANNQGQIKYVEFAW
ncbi:MAG TPA: hypothetical protein PKI63_09150 [Candidatus Cloacimonadota bacterium]|nr:hypothetical protein [Candidatus Cloacimonadota bacterium]HOH79846.1 hypothetical protein [Candidatus Cloacimonadota bacterium]